MSDPRRWADRMSASDALCWALDGNEGCRASLGVLLLLDKWPGAEAVRGACADLVERLPRLRQRVLEVPLAAAPPEWVRDDRFVLENHLRQVALPKADLTGLLASLRPRLLAPLARDRPLWEAYLVPQLADGRAAIFFKVHQSATQGLGLSRILDVLTGRETSALVAADANSRTPRLVTPDALLWRAIQFNLEETQADLALVWQTVRDLLTRPTQAAQQAWTISRAALDSLGGQALRRSSDLIRQARRRSRRLLGVVLPTADLRRTAQSLDATEVEVVLALVSAAVDALDTAPGAPTSLLAWVPLALPTQLPGDSVGLESIIGIQLPRGSTQPVAHLRAVQDLLRAASPERRLRWYGWMARLLSSVPAGVATTIGWDPLVEGDVVHVTRAGSSRRRTFAGVNIDAAFPFAPVLGRPSMSIAAHEYRGRLHLGLDAESAVAHHADDFEEELHRAWRGLSQAATQRKLTQP